MLEVSIPASERDTTESVHILRYVIVVVREKFARKNNRSLLDLTPLAIAHTQEKASYSKAYEHKLPGTNHAQMFLATVLCGLTRVYGTTLAQSLKRAPELPSTHACAPGLYDCVKGGPHSGSFMYIVYQSDQAYPLYLYTYRR